MKSAFNIALRKDLFSFVKKAFREDQGQKLGQQPYIEYMCCELSKIRTGQDRAAAASEDLLHDLSDRLVSRTKAQAPGPGHRLYRRPCGNDLSSRAQYHALRLV